MIRSYRRTLAGDRRKLLERYRYVHAARKVVGVGSVGTRAWICLLLGRDGDDPLFLQFKEAQQSVLEPFLGRSEFANSYARVCGMELARAHARAGDGVAIGSYLGGGDTFDRAMARFAEAYADQNEKDYAALKTAVEVGRVSAEFGL